MTSTCTIATCVLNQWALDFEGNYERIFESIYIAKKSGAKYRGGPELEVSGYGCEDHFYESDTLFHSWEVLANILSNKNCNDIVIDIGMPVSYEGSIYNCRVICLNGKIILIRPKQMLADRLVFRESRWFTNWDKINQIKNFVLPTTIQNITNQKYVPFGDALLIFNDCVVGIETCQEIWGHHAPHEQYYLEGTDIIFNGNGSNHMLRKLDLRMNLINAATSKTGGAYVYTNLRGCDAERVYYDGGAIVSVNGNIVAQGQQFSLEDIEVLTCKINLEEIRTYRHYTNISSKSHIEYKLPRINVDYCLSSLNDLKSLSNISRPLTPRIISPAEEISIAPALWLWDHLRRSGLNGFFLPLSGGVDSSSVACLVHSMCVQVYRAIKEGNQQVQSDLCRIVKEDNYVPESAEEICSRIFVTCYMSTVNNSDETKQRAISLSETIGSCHLWAPIDTVVSTMLNVAITCLNASGFYKVSSKSPIDKIRFKNEGGSYPENIALQNVQARTRMVLSYLLAQLYWWARGKGGGLLVLSSSNLDESLRGYLTKYDCSSGDLNPIGSICKEDLRMFIRFYMTEVPQLETSLRPILESPPTAELEPLSPTGQLSQTDEQDMGMTYAELSQFGKLRKLYHCGPRSMFLRLLEIWSDLALRPIQIAEKVKHFFTSYSKNRHKMTVVTPAYHVEMYDCEDNRYDLRPFLYRNDWKWQFRCIDQLVEKM